MEKPLHWVDPFVLPHLLDLTPQAWRTFMAWATALKGVQEDTERWKPA